MREPVIEDNASDHALFCKYAAELLERVTGKSLATSTAVPSLSRITKVWYRDLTILTESNGFICEESPQNLNDVQRLMEIQYCSTSFI